MPGPLTRELVAERPLEALLTPFAVIFLYYPSRRQALPKLRAFIEHMKSLSGRIGKTRRPSS